MTKGQAAVRRAPAKVNVWLSVGPKREDGYHSLNTVLLALALSDEITLSYADRQSLEVAGEPEVPTGEYNLCWRAHELFARHEPAARERPTRIHLLKRIPAGAGLGGGSSDAAAVLLALDQMFGNSLGPARLAGLGAELGSDVPFFLCGSPLAVGSGRGQEVTPLPAPPVRPVLILVPDFAVATAEAYGWLDAHRESRPGASHSAAADRRQDLRPRDWRDLEALAANDFEAPLFERYPVLEAGKRSLLKAGASVALLCGSGSCLFGVFEEPEIRDQAAAGLTGNEWQNSPFHAIRTQTLEPLPAG